MWVLNKAKQHRSLRYLDSLAVVGGVINNYV